MAANGATMTEVFVSLKRKTAKTVASRQTPQAASRGLNLPRISAGQRESRIRRGDAEMDATDIPKLVKFAHKMQRVPDYSCRAPGSHYERESDINFSQ